ncbi:MAG: glycosyltransferase family 87 protein [Candidatus Methylumidiphilus sp.]
MQTIFKHDLIKPVFFISMSGSILFLFGFAMVDEGDAFKYVMFRDPRAVFSDFYDCIVMSRGGHPYLLGSSYPALPNLIFAFFAKLIPDTTILRAGHDAVDLRAALVSFMIYCIIVLPALVILIFQNKEGGDIEKFVMVLLLLLSAPFLFLFERGNILLVSLVTLMAFLFWKNSERPWIRELAYISLAISAGIKLYPAIFGLLLVYDRKYSAALRCMIYGVILFIVPFYVYGGITGIDEFLVNLSASSASNSASFGFSVNASNTSRVFAKLAGGGWRLAGYVPYLILCASIVSFFMIKTEWKRITLLATVAILVPEGNGLYVLVLMAVPLILFLDAKAERTAIDWVYLLCFILIFIPMPLTPENFLPELNPPGRVGFYFYTVGTMMASLAVLLMSAALNLEGFSLFLQRQRGASRGWAWLPYGPREKSGMRPLGSDK